MKPLYIVNPASGGGTAFRAWESYQRSLLNLGKEVDSVVTEYPGHARLIASERRGYSHFVAFGGDGTAREVASGIVENPEKPILSIFPSGTGNDIAVALGIFSIKDAHKALEAGITAPCDIIKLTYTKNLQPIEDYALAYCSAGFSAIQWARPWMKRYLGAKLSYYLAIIKEIFVFDPPHLKLTYEDGSFEGRCIAIAIGNIESIGGGTMKVAPGALPGDGKMWVSVIPYTSRFNMLFKILPRAAKGTHLSLNGVEFFSKESVSIRGEKLPIIGVDGDMVGGVNVDISLLAHALQTITLKG